MSALKTIDSLIDKQDNSEVIRDQIAAILLCDVAEQMNLAGLAGKDPEKWNLQIYTEATDPYEKWLNIGEDENFDFSSLDKSPIVNVWFQSEDFEMAASNVVENQKANGTFNIDVYALGINESDGGTGQISGDKAAALEAQRAMRLVRNILMGGVNTYLQLRKTVWRRWTRNIEFFQPQLGQTNVQQVVAGRLSLGVEYSEFAPQITPVNLEEVGIKVRRAEDGEVVLEADYVDLQS